MEHLKTKSELKRFAANDPMGAAYEIDKLRNINAQLLEELGARTARLKIAVEALRNIGHRNERPGHSAACDYGYLLCCEDVIEDAEKVLKKINASDNDSQSERKSI